MATYLITGASRGIGLELVKQLLELPSSQIGKIFALSRSGSDNLRDLISKNPERVIPITVSVDSTESVERAAGEVKSKLGSHGLDVLVNNAGIGPASPAADAATIPPEQLAEIFDVNVIGVQRMTAAFLPLLEAGEQKKVVNITSPMGSITWAPYMKEMPTHAYNISKAALNMLTVKWALDYESKGYTIFGACPGWLKTDLGGQIAELEVEEGVAALKNLIVQSGKAQNGKFMNIHVPGKENAGGRYDGKEVPW